MVVEHNWRTAPGGALIVNPVLGWSGMSFKIGMIGALRLEYAINASSLSERGDVQLLLTLSQVTELKQLLANMEACMQKLLAVERANAVVN